jgi:hypothetical protein
MYESHINYWDSENPEDFLRNSFYHPEGLEKIVDQISDLNFHILDLDREWDELQAIIQKKRNKAEKIRGTESEKESLKADIDDAERKAEEIVERRQRAMERKMVFDRMERIRRDEDEKDAKRREAIDKAIAKREERELREKVRKTLEGMGRQELIATHFEVVQRDKSLPSRKAMLEEIAAIIGEQDWGEKRPKGKQEPEFEKKKNSLPPTRVESEKEEDLQAGYLSSRRRCQTLESNELFRRWHSASEALDNGTHGMDAFLKFKASAFEIMARFSIQERGSVGEFPTEKK